jgi:hypothetical protein
MAWLIKRRNKRVLRKALARDGKVPTTLASLAEFEI